MRPWRSSPACGRSGCGRRAGTSPPHAVDHEQVGLSYDSSLMADDEPYELLADGRRPGIVEIPVEWIRDDAPVFHDGALGSLRPYMPPRGLLDDLARRVRRGLRRGRRLPAHPAPAHHRPPLPARSCCASCSATSPVTPASGSPPTRRSPTSPASRSPRNRLRRHRGATHERHRHRHRGAPGETQLSRKQRKAIVAGSIGNTVEWVDWAVYATLAPVFASQFFPSGDPTAALLSTLAVFAVGFVMRPIGGAVLGAYADRHGRKKGLTLTIGMMAAAAFVIAICPTYTAIGIAAPLVLLLARLVQGFSAGGEFGSSSSFLVESAAPRRRAFAGSWQQVSVGAGALIASFMGFVLTSTLSEPAMQAYGWRIAFGIGGLLGLVGLWLRVSVEETDGLPACRRGGPQPQAQPHRRDAHRAPACRAARRRHHDRRHPDLLHVGQLHARIRAHGAGHPAGPGAAGQHHRHRLLPVPAAVRGAAVRPVRPQADVARLRDRVRGDRLPGVRAGAARRLLAAAGGRAGRA